MRTPHYNHLCRQGIEFRSAYADCPICVPARVSIMSGKHAFHHGLTHNGVSSRVLGRGNTLPALLGQAGYQTLAVGKMHFIPERARHGFDETILPADYYRWLDRSGFPCKPMRHGLGQNELYPGMATVPESLTLTNWIADQCVEFIRERRDPTRPFFLWCSFSKPHPPLDPPEPYYSMYRGCDIPEPRLAEWSEDDKCPLPPKVARQAASADLIRPEIIREARAAYYGLITQIDYNLGRVFAALQDMNLFDDALILYTSDHGEMLGDHRMAGKCFAYEGSAHVPFCLRLPQKWSNRRAGTAVRSPVTHADILPTLVGAAGGRIPDDIDGIDLIALARGNAEPRQSLEMQCKNFAPGTGCNTALTDGRWKYIWYPEGEREQLFDLESDPGELEDLAPKPAFAGRLAEMRAELVPRHRRRGSPFVAEDKWVGLKPPPEPPDGWRNSAWPGYHTEFYVHDVRH